MKLKEKLKYFVQRFFGITSVPNSSYYDYVSKSIGYYACLEYVAERVKRNNHTSELESSFYRFVVSNFHQSRSQSLQDLFVLWATSAKVGLTCLEAGAADGCFHSNTFSLESKYKWNCILVEPNPSYWNALKASRPHAICFKNALSSQTNELLSLTEAGQLSVVESLATESALLQETTAGHKLNHFQASTLSLSELQKEYNINYLSLDLEGYEPEALLGLDPSLYLPDLITVEHNHNQRVMKSVREITYDLGYFEPFKNEHWLTKTDFWLIRKNSKIIDSFIL